MKNYMIVEHPTNKGRMMIYTSFNAPKQIKIKNRVSLQQLTQLIKDEFSFQVMENLYFCNIEVYGYIPPDRLSILIGRVGFSRVKITYISPTTYDVYKIDGDKL